MPAYGWIQTPESIAWLRANQVHFERSRFAAMAIPAEINNFGKVPVKDQGQVGACSGFSRSTIEELLQLQSGNDVRLSALYAYITNQQADGSVGQDTGATISGSVQAALKSGICRDELMPFRGQYDSTIPDQAASEGQQHLIQSHSILSTPQAIMQYIATAGFVQIGIPVGQQFQNCGGILTSRAVQADARNPGGGHALPVIGYVTADTLRGYGLSPQSTDPYFDIQNSWTEQYGYKGHCFIESKAMQVLCSMMGHGNVEIAGMSKFQSFDAAGDDVDFSHLYG